MFVCHPTSPWVLMQRSWDLHWSTLWTPRAWKSDTENRRVTKSGVFIRVLVFPRLDLLIQTLLSMEGFSSPGLAKARSLPTMVVPPSPCGHGDTSSALVISSDITLSPEDNSWKEKQRWQHAGNAGERSRSPSWAQPCPACSASSLSPAAPFSKQAYIFLIYPLFLSKHPKSQFSGSIF